MRYIYYVLPLGFLLWSLTVTDSVLCAASTGMVSRQAVPSTDQYYGAGSHAVFARQYVEAIAIFDEAETAGSRDPRCYFLRGVAKWRTGDTEAATADFAVAASLEWEFPAVNTAAVSAAIARVQGPERVQVEQARRIAKDNWTWAEQKRRIQRYGDIRQQERELVYTQIATAPTTNYSNITPPIVGETTSPLPFGAQPINPSLLAGPTGTLTAPIVWGFSKEDIDQKIRAIPTKTLAELKTSEQGSLTSRGTSGAAAPKQTTPRPATQTITAPDPFGDPFGSPF